VSNTRNVSVSPPKRIEAIRPLYIGDLASTTRVITADVPPGFLPSAFTVVAEIGLTETEQPGTALTDTGQHVFHSAKELKTAIICHLVVEAAIRKQDEEYVKYQILHVKPTKV
jgi:hypothetical protein